MQATGVESLWDEFLPAEVKALPEDLAALDQLLCDPALLAPIAVRWERLLADAGRHAGRGRPTIAMETYARLMIIKHRSGWGYETLMREVSDSIHLRRFCRIGMSEPVPDESTVRKLTRRLGAEVVHEITRELIQKARREKRFWPRAARIDSTVVKADVKYPTDSGLADAGVRALAREGRKLAAGIGEKRNAVRDRSRSMGRKLRALTRSIRRRSGEAKTEVLKLTGETGTLLKQSIREARKLAVTARRRARGRGARAKLEGRRGAGGTRRSLREGDRADSSARQRREDHQPTDLAVGPGRAPDPQGQTRQTDGVRVRRSALRDHREHEEGRARVHPAPTSQIGNPAEDTLLPATAQQLRNLDIKLKEIMVDGAFTTTATNTALEDLADTVHIASRQEPGSRRTRRRRQRYRTGMEGRVSHLKRSYGLRRSRLKGDEGHQIWDGWATFAYNAGTYTTLG
jgi:IS5 family transposase